ncbi:hypothetical protein T12_15136 [Trichinella patagoniensis]|uniref:Uncharacterized protein n=1 Tax=Trichinella patagoniensis TaxID=990121 RepID=A0A0V0ZW62_9BILA|nr:hypothetical protein T12_15136 [Trichinella patagoniensis]
MLQLAGDLDLPPKACNKQPKANIIIIIITFPALFIVCDLLIIIIKLEFIANEDMHFIRSINKIV